MKTIIISIIIVVAWLRLDAQNNIDLIAHYPMNGDAADISVYKNHGIINGNILVAKNRYGQDNAALQFNGNEYITVSHNSALALITDSLTITAWAKLTGNNYWFTICTKGDKPYEDIGSPHFRFQLTRVTAALNSEVVGKMINRFNLNSWYFLAMTYNGKHLKVYVNGIQMLDTLIQYKMHPNQEDLIIGRDIQGEDEYFIGILDDLRLYNRALSQQEITTIMNDIDKTTLKPFVQSDTIVKTDTLRKTVVVNDTLKQIVLRSDTLRSTVQKVDTLKKTVILNDTLRKTVIIEDKSILPQKVGGIPIQYQQTIVVNSKCISILPFDDRTYDEDSVSINFNGTWIVENLNLKSKTSLSKKDLLKICLEPGDNYLISKAINLGSVPPNTLSIEIRDGNAKPIRYKIHSDYSMYGAIRIIYNK